MRTHSSILAWKLHGQRSLKGYCPWGYKESDIPEHVCMHIHIKYMWKLISSQSGHTREPYFRLFYRGNPQQQIESPYFWQATPLGSHTHCCGLLESEPYPPSVKSRASKFHFRRRYFSLPPFEARCITLKFFILAVNWVNIPGLEFRDLIAT